MMNCPRCGGLMIKEWFLDVRDDAGEMHFDGVRCLTCGEIMDPLILENRKKQLAGVSLK